MQIFSCSRLKVIYNLGILVAKRHIFEKKRASNGGGGGSVFFVTKEVHTYLKVNTKMQHNFLPKFIYLFRT